MHANPLLQTGLDLSEEILDAYIEVDIADLKEEWNQVAFFYLRRARQSLRAVNMLLPDGLGTPSVVLVRYLFELAVRLRYMDATPEDRVPDFLSHSQPTDPADSGINDQIRDQIEHGNYEDAMKAMIPGRPWGNLKGMCEELELLEHYWTVYRASSELTHGGGHGMAQDHSVALGAVQVSDWKAPGILYTAIIYYKWVFNVNLNLFPSLASRFSLNADWQDRLEAFQNSVKSMQSTA